jgi:hypothetical protein
MRGMTSHDQLDNLASTLVDGARAFSRAAEQPGSEQEVRLTGALHDVAAAFARCARACRQGGSTVTPIISRRIDDGRSWLSTRTAPTERVA